MNEPKIFYCRNSGTGYCLYCGRVIEVKAQICNHTERLTPRLNNTNLTHKAELDSGFAALNDLSAAEVEELIEQARRLGRIRS